MSELFEPPKPFVLRETERERSVVAVASFTNDAGEVVRYVRAGVQWRSESGEWVWKRGAGVSLPLRRLGALAAWLVDVSRAIARPEPSTAKGWDR